MSNTKYMKNPRTTTFRIEKGYHTWLKREAKIQKISMGEFIRRLIEERRVYISHKEYKRHLIWGHL